MTHLSGMHQNHSYGPRKRSQDDSSCTLQAIAPVMAIVWELEFLEVRSRILMQTAGPTGFRWEAVTFVCMRDVYSRASPCGRRTTGVQ